MLRTPKKLGTLTTVKIMEGGETAKRRVLEKGWKLAHLASLANLSTTHSVPANSDSEAKGRHEHAEIGGGAWQPKAWTIDDRNGGARAGREARQLLLPLVPKIFHMREGPDAHERRASMTWTEAAGCTGVPGDATSCIARRLAATAATGIRATRNR